MRAELVRWLAGFVRPDVADLIAPTWFTCIGLAGLAAYVLLRAGARRRGLDAGAIAAMLAWAYAAAVLAGIAMPMLIDAVQHLATTGHLRVRWSGMTSFWGYLAGLGAAVHVARRERLPLGAVADLAVIPLGVALAIARLGCFVAGCDYGTVTSGWWAVRFPAGSPAWQEHVHAGWIPASRAASLPVHPTQLYEAAIGLALVAFALVAARWWRRRDAGALFLAGAAIYALARLVVVEPLRGDVGRGIYGGLASGQIFALLVLAAIAARVLVRAARVRATVTAVAAAALVVGVGHAGEAHAEPPATAPAEDPPAEDPPAEDPPVDETPIEVPAPRTPPLRPHLRLVTTIGIATPTGTNAMPTSTTTGIAVGYTPGWFGVWLDLEHLRNAEASHDAAIASVSFARRVTPRLTLGARAGFGITRLGFDAPAFAPIVARTARLDAFAELAVAPTLGVWFKPLAIDSTRADALGGAITTVGFAIGIDYRFAFHRARLAHPPAPPVLPPPPPIALGEAR